MAGYSDRVYTSVKIKDRVVEGGNPGWEHHIMTFDASNGRRAADAWRRISLAGGVVDSEAQYGSGGWRRVVRWHKEEEE